ncbi:MAG: acetylxylan esterase [Bacteroidia bacterium]|nr:acetylxylan esterase [Bacteroidia bacterium]
MKISVLRTSVILLTAIIWYSTVSAQDVPASENRIVAGIPVNYDEAKVGSYTLPDPLVMLNGKKVKNEKMWYKKRRPEILNMFYEYQYGKVPEKPKDMSFNLFDKGTPALDGKALRKQVTVYFTKDTSDFKMDILIYLPANAKGPVPLFLNFSFSPNAAVANDSGIKAGTMWGRDGKRVPVSRTGRFGRMNITQFLDEGIGFANICYGDIEPDFAKGYKSGIRSYYARPDTTYPAPDQWGAISAWSWGLSRAMDYFETDPQIDAKKIALFGVSRLGKTVLWTGARDTRFGMVIASCGGEGGAAISRRNYGENIDHMTHPTRYFYQFAGNWRNYKDDFSKSPVDAHMLVALMAPRPLLLQTGDTDYWSDPKGEFLAAVAAEPVWTLLGKKGLGTTVWPAAGTPILYDLGYYMHAGGHGSMPTDYPVFIKFMKMHFFNLK